MMARPLCKQALTCIIKISMIKKLIVAVAAVLVIIIIGLAMWLLTGSNIAVLNPKGAIAAQERDLILFTVLLSLIIVIPVFFLTFMIAWKYRASNKKAKYTPDWDGNKWIETIWWGIPCAIIVVLGIVTWQTTHKLDPYRALSSNVKPLTIQVVALQWKWLFIYPEQRIASVNEVRLPVKTPINFVITADAPMNSFWIPNLGGQVYAMNGMSTKLHLIADTPGDYPGSSANISGKGFAKMTFTAKATTIEDFNAWVVSSKLSPDTLDSATYAELAKPGQAKTPLTYSLSDTHLYDQVIMKYMAPMDDHTKHGGHGEMKGI